MEHISFKFPKPQMGHTIGFVCMKHDELFAYHEQVSNSSKSEHRLRRVRRLLNKIRDEMVQQGIREAEKINIEVEDDQD